MLLRAPDRFPRRYRDTPRWYAALWCVRSDDEMEIKPRCDI